MESLGVVSRMQRVCFGVWGFGSGDSGLGFRVRG